MKITKQLTLMRSGLIALMVAALTGCGGGGDGGGAAAPVVPVTPEADAALVAQAKPEQCYLCHTTLSNGSSFAKTGPDHQAIYADYADASNLTLTVDNVTNNGTDSFLTFTATKNGVPLTQAQVAALPQKTFYAVQYDSATRTYGNPTASFSYTGGTTAANYVPTGTPGQFTVKKTAAAFFPETQTGAGQGAQAYAYITDGPLNTEGMQLYDDVANAAKAYGDAAAASPNAYQSAANVSACETCHGKPYMKHGYRAAQVAGLPDFAACKDCHYDSRNGGHQDWQLLKDDPATFAQYEADASACAAASNTTCDSIPEQMTAAEKAKYAYKASVMNDVHMSHAMEFPYPQSMQSCVTCHAGKLGDTAANDVFADAKFTAPTCVSCHAVDDLKAKMTTKASTGNPITIHDSFINEMDDAALRATRNCQGCHGQNAPNFAIAPAFDAIHKGGYNPKIYSTTGVRYSDTFVVNIDSVVKNATDPNKIDITFSATGVLGALDSANITPTILVGLYGYDTKDFIVAAHNSAADGKRNLEYIWGSTAANNATTRFTQVSKTTAAGTTTWKVTADLTLWADKIADDVVRRAEIAVLPSLSAGADVDFSGSVTSSDVLGLNAPSKTYNFASNALENYFPDLVNVFKTANPTTGSLDGCNTCHDQLATTFHSGIRGGNIKVCRICHEVSSPGSHLEDQGRSIDSYVHAIHSFQAFDVGDIDFEDPTQDLEYRHHVSHTFPRFTIQNCEACHVSGSNIYASGRKAFDVPDQHKSMPGVLSGTDTIENRDLQDIGPSVTGPAVRACGACHRAQAINADDSGRLATMIAHWQTFGYYIETTSDKVRALWEAVVAKIMAVFG